MASHTFRQRTMEVLRLAFLSSAVLEFFTAISIAVVAVYFGFNFIGELDFGHYGAPISLFTGLFVLVLAPEFYQPLRDLGTFYHAKAQAIGAAESIVDFLDAQPDTGTQGDKTPDLSAVAINAHDLEVLSQMAKYWQVQCAFQSNRANRLRWLVSVVLANPACLMHYLAFFPTAVA